MFEKSILTVATLCSEYGGDDWGCSLSVVVCVVVVVMVVTGRSSGTEEEWSKMQMRVRVTD
jgi:hypothetical protein